LIFVASFIWNLSNCCQISNEYFKKFHETQLLGQEFWILMSLLTLFRLSTGIVQGPGPREECLAKISMFFFCRIFINVFFSFVRIFIFGKLATLILKGVLKVVKLRIRSPNLTNHYMLDMTLQSCHFLELLLSFRDF
jgi:hypothetical protein